MDIVVYIVSTYFAIWGADNKVNQRYIPTTSTMGVYFWYAELANE